MKRGIMVPAEGIGIFKVIENTQLIDFPRRSKIKNLRNCAQLERIWNTAFVFGHVELLPRPLR